jgi:hypothetical protein
VVDAVYMLTNHINRIYNDQFDYKQFAIIKTLGQNYKSASNQMAVFRDFLYSVGKTVKPGDRLEFLVIVNPYATKLGQKMVLTEQYVESMNTPTPYRIDYNYYIDHMLKNPINQLFGCGFLSQLSYLNDHVSFKLGRWVNTRGISEIVDVIMKAKELELDIFAVHQYIKDVDTAILTHNGIVPTYRY